MFGCLKLHAKHLSPISIRNLQLQLVNQALGCSPEPNLSCELISSHSLTSLFACSVADMFKSFVYSELPAYVRLNFLGPRSFSAVAARGIGDRKDMAVRLLRLLHLYKP